jgi:hypothetical protein
MLREVYDGRKRSWPGKRCLHGGVDYKARKLGVTLIRIKIEDLWGQDSETARRPHDFLARSIKTVLGNVAKYTANFEAS